MRDLRRILLRLGPAPRGPRAVLLVPLDRDQVVEVLGVTRAGARRRRTYTRNDDGSAEIPFRSWRHLLRVDTRRHA